MRLSEVQLFLARKITSDPALAALGDPFIYDPQRTVARNYNPGTGSIVDDAAGRSFKDAIKARLQEPTGVTIDIEWPVVGGATNTVGASFARVFVPIFIAERAGTTHTPTGLVLVDAVIAALKARSGSAWIVDVTDYEFDDDEHGSVLHIVTAAISTRSP